MNIEMSNIANETKIENVIYKTHFYKKSVICNARFYIKSVHYR